MYLAVCPEARFQTDTVYYVPDKIRIIHIQKFFEKTSQCSCKYRRFGKFKDLRFSYNSKTIGILPFLKFDYFGVFYVWSNFVRIKNTIIKKMLLYIVQILELENKIAK